MELSVLQIIFSLCFGVLFTIIDISSSRYRFCKGVNCSLKIWLLNPLIVFGLLFYHYQMAIIAVVSSVTLSMLLIYYTNSVFHPKQ